MNATAVWRGLFFPESEWTGPHDILELSCANEDMICMIRVTSAIEDNYILIQQLTFQSAVTHWPTSLGRAALKIATLGTG